MTEVDRRRLSRRQILSGLALFGVGAAGGRAATAARRRLEATRLGTGANGADAPQPPVGVDRSRSSRR